MKITPKERAREDYMKEYELTEEEMKEMEDTAYFQSRVLNYAIEDLKQSLKEEFNRISNRILNKGD